MQRAEEEKADLLRERQAEVRRRQSLLQLRLIEDEFAAENLARLKQGQQLAVSVFVC